MEKPINKSKQNIFIGWIRIVFGLAIFALGVHLTDDPGGSGSGAAGISAMPVMPFLPVFAVSISVNSW